MALLPYRPLQTWWVRRARPTEQAGCRVLKALLLALSLKAAPFDPLRPVPLSPPACSDATWLPAWPGLATASAIFIPQLRLSVSRETGEGGEQERRRRRKYG